MSRIALTLGALALFSGPALAADPPADVARGKKLFLYCAACHNLQTGQPAKIGPVLAGVLGAKAGVRDDYAYSEPLRASGITWSDEALAKWLTQPDALVPGTKMAFVGLSSPEDRAALIAYLHQAAR